MNQPLVHSWAARGHPPILTDHTFEIKEGSLEERIASADFIHQDPGVQEEMARCVEVEVYGRYPSWWSGRVFQSSEIGATDPEGMRRVLMRQDWRVAQPCQLLAAARALRNNYPGTIVASIGLLPLRKPVLGKAHHPISPYVVGIGGEEGRDLLLRPAMENTFLILGVRRL